MWAPFIIVGFTWWFAIYIVAISIVFIWAIEDDKPGLALVMTIVGVAILTLFSTFNPFTWITQHPYTFIKFCVAYIPIGLAYSMIKYYFYLKERTRVFDKRFENFLEKYKLDSTITYENLPVEYRSKCYEYMDNYSGGYNLLNMTFGDSTKHIVFWMGYWPWSAFWTLLNNPIKWLLEWLRDQFIGVYRRIWLRSVGKRQNVMDNWNK